MMRSDSDDRSSARQILALGPNISRAVVLAAVVVLSCREVVTPITPTDPVEISQKMVLLEFEHDLREETVTSSGRISSTRCDAGSAAIAPSTDVLVGCRKFFAKSEFGIP